MELSEKLSEILEKPIMCKVRKVGENAYRVVGVREGKGVWKSDVGSDLREVHRIIARMSDVGV